MTTPFLPGPAAALYCEALFELAEDDIDTLQARVAERLGVSRPAVSEMVHRLEELGLVDASDRTVRLTPAGFDLAESSVRRHRLAERLLTDVLGLGWAEAHELAIRWQQAIDDRTEPAVVKLLGDPATCPHGNPIPGRPQKGSAGVALADLPVGQVGQVLRITEQLEVEPGMLTTLENAGLIPGTRVSVVAVSADGSLAVQASRSLVALTSRSGHGVLVVPGDLSVI